MIHGSSRPSGKQDFKHGTRAVDRTKMMEGEGWTQCGQGRWLKDFNEVNVMPEVSGGDFVRRAVWDRKTGYLLEDLWKTGRTPERTLKRALRRPKDIRAVVESDDAGDGEALTWDEQLMSSSDATQFRAMVARINFLSTDRADIQFATKEASRRMTKPINADWKMVTRLARYLLKYPRAVHLFEWQSLPGRMRVYVDSNWAGCLRTRRGTTGICYARPTPHQVLQQNSVERSALVS